MIRTLLALFAMALSFSAFSAPAQVERCFKLEDYRNESLSGKFEKKRARLLKEGYVEFENLTMRKEKQKFVGIGIGIAMDFDANDRVVIVDTVPGSPAEGTGVGLGTLKGSHILAVNGVSIPTTASTHSTYADREKRLIGVKRMIVGNGKVGTGVVLTVKQGDSRVYERYMERKRLTSTLEKPYVCFEKKGQ